MLYTDTHDWILIHRDDVTLAKVGLSHFGQKEIGEIVFVDLPKVGATLKKGEVAAVIESTKAAIDLYAVVGGKIIAINEDLRKKPFLINHSPEEDGWLYLIRLHDILTPPDRFGLLTPQAYKARS